MTRKRGLERQKIKEITIDRKEKKRESENRSYKKKKNKDKKSKEKENMKGNQRIHFNMDFLKNLIKRTFCSTSFIFTGKRSLKRHNIKEIKKEREKKRQENQKNEVIKRKEKNDKKKRKEKKKGLWKENQKAAVDKSLPGVQARCALFMTVGGGRWRVSNFFGIPFSS